MKNQLSSKHEILAQWKQLTSVEQLDQVIAESCQHPVAIFKHSTRCSRSAFAKHKLEADFAFKENELSFYYLDLLAHRDVSNAIAEKLGIRHQSPQILVMKDKKVIFHTSHETISINGIEQAIH